MQVRNVAVTIVDVPQVAPVAPYRSRYRTTSSTCSGIVQVDTDDGLTGWGEFNANFHEFSAEQMQRSAAEWIIGRDPLNLNLFHAECPLEVRLKSGLEMALWDIAAKAAGVPLAELLGGIIRPEVELAACMGIQTYERAGEIATQYVESGYSTLKTKAGANADEDVAMVRGIRDAVGNALKLRIDPNTGYSRDEAAALARRLEEYDLEYFEQPLPEAPLEDAVWLRHQTRVPIALNESVTDPASVIEIVKLGAAEFVLPDTHIAGGVLPCMIIGRICEAAGVTTVMHCSHDLGPKTAAMVHIAAACPAYALANDSTYYGLEDDVTREPLPIVRGRIAVPSAPGLGVEIDPAKLARYRVG